MLEYSNISASFVTTNSISQGEQVQNVWSAVLNKGIEIIFAYEAFPWKNNAKGNAVVTCVIFGLSKKGQKKFIFNSNSNKLVKEIGPYLTENNIIVKKSNNSLCNLPKMALGDMAKDGGHLVFEEQEKLNSDS